MMRGMRGMEDMMGAMGGMGGAAAKKKQLVTQTRTDFLIQFVWQPPTPDKPAKPIEEIRKALAAAENDEKNKGAVAAYDSTKLEKQLEQESIKGSQNLIKAATSAPAAAPGTPGRLRDRADSRGSGPGHAGRRPPAPTPPPGPRPAEALAEDRSHVRRAVGSTPARLPPRPEPRLDR